MNKSILLVLDDYEGELANAPDMARIQQLAEVTILNRPIGPGDYDSLKGYQILLALRERTGLDSSFFEACPNLELVLQTGGHAYHIDQTAATKRGIVVALGRRVSKPGRSSMCNRGRSCMRSRNTAGSSAGRAASTIVSTTGSSTGRSGLALTSNGGSLANRRCRQPDTALRA